MCALIRTSLQYLAPCMLCDGGIALSVDQPVAKMGLFGPNSEYVYCLTTIETLQLWNIKKVSYPFSQ
jgi:hypothetical protein